MAVKKKAAKKRASKKKVVRKKAAKKQVTNKRLSLKDELANLSVGQLQALMPKWRIVTELQPRHYEFTERAANLENRTLPQMVERFIRIHYATDPYKSGLINPETDHGFSGKASDMSVG